MIHYVLMEVILQDIEKPTKKIIGFDKNDKGFLYILLSSDKGEKEFLKGFNLEKIPCDGSLNEYEINVKEDMGYLCWNGLTLNITNKYGKMISLYEKCDRSIKSDECIFKDPYKLSEDIYGILITDGFKGNNFSMEYKKIN